MIFIVLFNIILYALIFIWTYKNMYGIENRPKFIYIIASTIIVYIVTKILYNIGGNPIGKQFGEAAVTFNRTMIFIFTGINELIIIPHIGSSLNKLKEQLIDTNQFKKRLVVISIIFIVFLIFEFNYMKDMQGNMLEMIKQK